MKHDAVFDGSILTSYDGVEVRLIDRLPDFRFANTFPEHPKQTRLCINLKGCNGSGKSTIPMTLVSTTSRYMYLTASAEDKKPCAMYIPDLRLVILGVYSDAVNCGGCDSLGDTQIVKSLLLRLWKKDVHILFEGVIVGDIKSTFYEIMLKFSGVYVRNIIFTFMGTKFSTCLARIQSRNGGKPINTELVKQKYKNSVVQLKYYLDQGDVGVQVLDTSGTKIEVVTKFMKLNPELEKMWIPF